MPKIAIIHDPSSSHVQTWRRWLESAGLSVDTIHDDQGWQNSDSASYDLVIPLITIRDYVDGDNARTRALAHFEAIGAKLLTPSAAIASSSDKLKTARLLQANSIPHPTTSLAEDYVWDSLDPETPVLKPRFGHSGHDIRLVHSQSELGKYLPDTMLLQQFIDQATCIRVIATDQTVLSAYKKTPPAGTFIANVNQGAARQPAALTADIKQLAQSTVNALGGGLMGVDLLDSPAGLFALEANVPFGFDKSDDGLGGKLTELIIATLAQDNRKPT